MSPPLRNLFEKKDKNGPYITFDVKRLALYNQEVIKTFRDEETEKVFHRQFSRKLPSDIQLVALRKLRMLNNAYTIADLRIPPANRLEKLTGNRAGQYSIRINDQWRICFEWRNNTVYNVEITDYH
jgi:proteic killer suppression protein